MEVTNNIIRRFVVYGTPLTFPIMENRNVGSILMHVTDDNMDVYIYTTGGWKKC